MSAEQVKVRIGEGMGEIILDRPPVNALDSAGWLMLARTIDAGAGK